MHSESNAPESSKTTPATLSAGETAVHTTVPGAKKSGDCCSQEHTLRDSESVYKTVFKCFLKTALQSKKMKKKNFQDSQPPPLDHASLQCISYLIV